MRDFVFYYEVSAENLADFQDLELIMPVLLKNANRFLFSCRYLFDIEFWELYKHNAGYVLAPKN